MAKKTEVKFSQTNVDDGLLSNKRSWNDVIDREFLALSPGRDDWRERLIRTLYAWSERSTSLEILQFCMEYKIPRTTLFEWAEKYPDIKKAYESVKLNVACHRRVGTMNKKLDGAYAYKDMHKYDDLWGSVDKYHADLKRDEEKQPTTFVLTEWKPKVKSQEEMQKESESNL
jgi:hypothetical protein